AALSVSAPSDQFARDSPLEEAVSSELVSEAPKFCSSGPPSAAVGSQSSKQFNGLRRNFLRIGTGNLFRPSRELNRAIREFIRLIRESRAGRHFTSTLNRVSEHSRTMSRVPEEMSFTHAEGIRWLADLPERDRRPLDAWIC